MNNLPEFQVPASNAPTQFFDEERLLSDEERLQDYLEHLIAPLIGIVPYARRVAFRREVYAHLDGLIREYQWQGQDMREATESALREFGEPCKVGRAFLQEWLRGTACAPPASLIRKASVMAFAWFGIASMLILLLLEHVTLSPAQDSLLPGIEMLACLAPFVAGGLTGAMAPLQAGRGVRNVVLLLALHSIATGLLLHPRVEGLAFAVWQLLFWLPVGWVSAEVTAKCVWQVRRQRFWQMVR